jgi:mRNA-degrading endonuclease RelE of RelBE toxin-antitoxin system
LDLQKVIFLPRAEKDLKGLSPEIKVWLLETLQKINPEIADIRKIYGIKPSLWRLAIGDYRLLFRKAEDRLVIHRVIDRKELEKVLKTIKFG